MAAGGRCGNGGALVSATDIPLVTTDELNKILTRENDELRMREKVGKEAFDKLSAELAKVREQLAHVSLLAQAVRHVSELRRIEAMPTDQTASPDQCAAVAYAMDHLRSGDLPPHPDTAEPHFYSFNDDEGTECPEEWLDCACYSDGVHVVSADAFRRLPERYFVWAVNSEATKREDRQKILLETTDKAEAERVAAAARTQAGKEGV